MIILVLTPAYAQETKTTAKEETKDCDQHSEQWFFCTHWGEGREQIEEDKQRPQKDFFYMFMDMGSTYLPWRAWQVEMSILSKFIFLSITYETKSHFSLERKSGKQLH